MKRTRTEKKKFDYIFVLVIVAVIILSMVAGHLASIDVPTVDPQPLPADDENNIHELVISEIMSNNDGVFVNSENKKTDYLEIYNGTSKTINLKGYGLSDRTTTIKWAFSDCILEPGQYVAVALTGKLQEGLNAAFRLSSKGGETIMLVNPNSKVIDAVDTVSLGKNQAMMRDGNGDWFVSDFGTPGYPNTEAGLETYYASLQSEEESELVVNEFMARNKGNFRNKDGEYCGFIEFLNVSDHQVDLGEYTVGNSVNVPFNHTLDSVILEPGAVYSMYLGDNPLPHENYTGFTFDSANGVIVISRSGKIVQSVEYENLANGTAMVRTDRGDYIHSGIVSPGYLNNPEGIDAFQKAYMVNPNDLMINEVMSDNQQYLAQNGAKYYDWIEIKNNSDHEINLAEYCLGKSLSSLTDYQMPEVTLPAGGFVVFMASGNTALSNNSYKHLPFKVGDGDAVYLSREGVVIDSINVVSLPYGYSYGRGSADGFFYLAQPTPGAENGSGYRYQNASVEFSVEPGVYNGVSGGMDIELHGEGDIYYTTDGSVPTTSSARYTGPIRINRTTVIKARSMQSGALSSTWSCGSYIINENHTVPVVSVSMSPGDFNYINYNSDIRGLEVQAYMELFEKDGSCASPCSFACFGGNTRFTAKKSYALRFGREWGAANLKYQVFKNRDNSIYKALVLRSGSTDWTEAYIRDILGTSLVDDYTDVDVQAYKVVVVYFNGQYWGLYNLREKINKQFISEHYNVDPDSVNLARIDGKVSAGSNSGYNDLRYYARNNNLANDSAFNYMSERIDMVNLIDYWIAETYITNNDVLNVRFFQSNQIEGGKWHYIFYDLDYAWYNVNQNYYRSHLTNWSGMGEGWNYENDIIRNLFNNSKFRDLWLQRLSYNMKNTWNTSNVIGRINELYAVLQPEMQRNCNRWGLSYNYWVSCINELKQYATTRGRTMLTTTKAFFGLSDSQMRSLFGDLW